MYGKDIGEVSSLFSVAEVVPGLEVLFSVSAREGQWRFRHVFGTPPKRAPAEPRFAPGVDGAGQALTSPACFPAFHLSADGAKVWHVRPEEGAIDFWVRPNWDGAAVPWRLHWMKRVFVDIGPVRHDHPYLINTRSIAIHHTAGGALGFSIANARYKSRGVSGDVRGWKAGQWHHVACQWRLADGVCEMDLFLDGRKASGKPGGSAAPRFDKEVEALPVQVGAMNTGVLEADAAIDELRFSRNRRWDGDFQPQKKPGPDDRATIIFRFDGNLRGECPDGAVVNAEPGSAG